MTKILAALLLVGTLIVNGLANTLTLGGNTTGQVSDMYPNLFAPQGITFSIWLVIYLLLILFCVRAFTGSEPRNHAADAAVQRVLSWFAASSVLNITWLLAWHYHIMWLSVVLMVSLLLVLLKINAVLQPIRYSWKDELMVRAPFSIYLGWISVATIANVATWLVSIGWDGFGQSEEFWTVVVLCVGALIAVTYAMRHNNNLYLAVFIWAYLGIWLRHVAPDGFNGQYPLVMFTAIAFVGIFMLTIVNNLISRKHPDISTRPR